MSNRANDAAMCADSSPVKLSDYVAQFLLEQGITKVFGLTGGAVVHLFNSIAVTEGIDPVFCHHEQAAALACQAYARVTGGLGAAFVTTGPGGTNAITGVTAAWLDSIPCMYISGQARLAHTTRGEGIRQLGLQQLDILSLVEPITKYAAMVEDASLIKYYLQRAVHAAAGGRPGPVWLDLPMDFQWTFLTPDSLPSFIPSEQDGEDPPPPQDDQIRRCHELLRQADRPLLLAGHGVRLSQGEAEFRELVTQFQIPYVTTWNAGSLMPTDDRLNMGRPGVFGQRGANLSVQNCDLLLSVGSHLAIALTGTQFDSFARQANIVMVDTDPAELDHRTVRVELPIRCDAKAFLRELLRRMQGERLPDVSFWHSKCLQYKSRHNNIPPAWKEQDHFVNPYVFLDLLSDLLEEGDLVVIDGGGTINQIAFQSLRFKDSQKIVISAGLCAMGSGLPESVGACFAGHLTRTICLCGDGSLQLNIQELQTIVHHHLPVKIFVFNNGGYLSIRNTQDGFLDSRYIGSCSAGGMSLPDTGRIAEAYGIPSLRIERHEGMEEKLIEALRAPGPAVCEVMVAPDQAIVPRQGFTRKEDGTFAARSLEDMDPPLERQELHDLMMTPTTTIRA